MTELSDPSVTAPMEPTRNPEVTLPDLITVLLDKGTYLNIDLIIAVADIPLIGINLRATIAGMETMLEYGMMRDWDEKTRAWVRQSVARNFPLAPHEEIIAKMAGGHLQHDFSTVWRPGSIYVTNQRLVVFRRDPKEVLWESALVNIAELRLANEKTIGSEFRTRLIVTTIDGETTTLSASAPRRICELLVQQHPQLHVTDTTGDQQALGSGQTPQKEEHGWYLETRAQSSIWRGGTVRIDGQRLQWQAPIDARPAVNLQITELTGVHTLHMATPTGRGPVLHVVTDRGSIHLAVANAEHWRQVLAAQMSP